MRLASVDENKSEVADYNKTVSMSIQSLIPTISFEGWEFSGIKDNQETCGNELVSKDGRFVYCGDLDGLVASVYASWKRESENIKMKDYIVLSVFEFHDKNNHMDKVLKVQKASPKFLNRSELHRTKIKKYEINIMAPKDDKNLNDLQNATVIDKTDLIKHVYYLDIFQIDNFVFTLHYENVYSYEAEKIIENVIERGK